MERDRSVSLALVGRGKIAAGGRCNAHLRLGRLGCQQSAHRRSASAGNGALPSLTRANWRLRFPAARRTLACRTATIRFQIMLRAIDIFIPNRTVPSQSGQETFPASATASISCPISRRVANPAGVPTPCCRPIPTVRRTNGREPLTRSRPAKNKPQGRLSQIERSTLSFYFCNNSGRSGRLAMASGSAARCEHKPRRMNASRKRTEGRASSVAWKSRGRIGLFFEEASASVITVRWTFSRGSFLLDQPRPVPRRAAVLGDLSRHREGPSPDRVS